VLELCPARWSDYELLDCGNFQKLERFGKVITIRPEPQALWHPVFPEKEWEKQAHVRFIQKGSSSGTWKSLRSEVSSSWKIHYRFENGPALTFRLALTGFKHVGVFPEQAVNWDYIYNSLTQLSGAKFLNLFAYTGGASIAARAAGADVTHVDSIRQVVSWARENMEFSGLKDIRWVVEDALKFVKREAKRGHYYHGIILDPPAYGHDGWGFQHPAPRKAYADFKCLLFRLVCHGDREFIQPANQNEDRDRRAFFTGQKWHEITSGCFWQVFYNWQ
jgi:23S rRNA (cytosine1962-C5)-methyltransferase